MQYGAPFTSSTVWSSMPHMYLQGLGADFGLPKNGAQGSVRARFGCSCSAAAPSPSSDLALFLVSLVEGRSWSMQPGGGSVELAEAAMPDGMPEEEPAMLHGSTRRDAARAAMHSGRNGCDIGNAAQTASICLESFSESQHKYCIFLGLIMQNSIFEPGNQLFKNFNLLSKCKRLKVFFV